MAQPFQRGDTWYGRVKDHTGQWTKPIIGKFAESGALMKVAEARRRNQMLQAQQDAIRVGAAPAGTDTHATLAELAEWWIEERASEAERKCIGRSVRKHIVPAALGKKAPRAVRSADVENFLQGLKDVLAPRTLNHLRAWLRRAYNAAKKSGHYHGDNPVTRDGVTKFKPVKKTHKFFKLEWIPPLLDHIAPQHRNLTAFALYHGLRKGELFGLKRTDIDLQEGKFLVARSHDEETTKGKHEDWIPLHPEAVPYLMSALASSPSALVFVNRDGKRYREDHDLTANVRAAMRRALIGVTHYEHKCRRRGCGHVEQQADGQHRLCPSCAMRLWPTPVVMPLRFHDTRHTTASLLARAGAASKAIQLILRHSKPEMTDQYTHGSSDFLQTEMGKLSFGPGFVPPLSHLLAPGAPAQSIRAGNPNDSAALTYVGATGFEPATPSPPEYYPPVTGDCNGSQTVVNAWLSSIVEVQSTAPSTGIDRDFVPPLSQGRLLSVGATARVLGVCDATVYKLCASGALQHVRIGANVIRVPSDALSAYLAGRTSAPVTKRGRGRPPRLLELGEKRHTIAEWARITGIKSVTIHQRLFLGWSVTRTLTYAAPNVRLGRRS